MEEHLLGCHSARGHVGQPKVLKRFAAEVLRASNVLRHRSHKRHLHSYIPFPNSPLHPSTGLQACLLLSDPALTGTAGPETSRSDKQVTARGSQSWIEQLKDMRGRPNHRDSQHFEQGPLTPGLGWEAPLLPAFVVSSC